MVDPMSTHEYLSETELPQPVVLVVGDESSYFSTQVWEGVLAANADRQEWEGVVAVNPNQPGTPDSVIWEQLREILDAPHNEIFDRLHEQGWDRRRRSPMRAPIPLQLTHERTPNPTQLRNHICMILDLFDVWGVIASASAGEVTPLRDALTGIDIPLLVTTDSTTIPPHKQPPSELRLMPSNRSQATTMLFAAIRANDRTTPEQSPESSVLRAPPMIAYTCEDTVQAHEYAHDLQEQFLAEAERHEVPVMSLSDGFDYDGPLVVIGYSAHARKVISARRGMNPTILSDGCATTAVRDAILEERGSNAESWLFTSPNLTLKQLGSTSFAAIIKAAWTVLSWDARSSSSYDISRTSLRDLIRNILQETDGRHFEFAGIQNEALAYHVVPVAKAANLAGPVPENDHLSDTGDHRGLRVIPGSG